MRITARGGDPWITVPKFDPVPEAARLAALKAEVQRRWGTLDLLDVLEDSNFLSDFTDEFTSVATRGVIDRVKSCSSSEVAAMIEGLLRHGTDADLDTNYVDTHGASLVGFAFTELLGFQLLPRLKNVGSIRLYRPDDTTIHDSLADVTRPIRWDLIAQQYDQMVKYATALHLGTADAETILRRFTRGGPKHPTYQALEEPGLSSPHRVRC